MPAVAAWCRQAGRGDRLLVGQDLGHAVPNPVDPGGNEVGLLAAAGLRREGGGPHERPERLVEVALGRLYGPDVEAGGGPPQPGGHGDSRGVTLQK